MKKKKRKGSAALRRKRSNGLGIIIFMVMIFCCFLFVRKLSLDEQKAEYQTMLEVKQKQLKELEKESEAIEEYRTYVQTKSYIEKVAREKLGLVYDDEIIFEKE